jgi:hypothetical protein
VTVFILTLRRPTGALLTKPCATVGEALELGSLWLDCGRVGFNIKTQAGYL